VERLEDEKLFPPRSARHDHVAPERHVQVEALQLFWRTPRRRMHSGFDGEAPAFLMGAGHCWRRLRDPEGLEQADVGGHLRLRVEGAARKGPRLAGALRPLRRVSPQRRPRRPGMPPGRPARPSACPALDETLLDAWARKPRGKSVRLRFDQEIGERLLP